MNTGYELLDRFVANIRDTLMYPFDPQQRIYVLYIATSILFAYAVYWAARRKGGENETSFLRFLFPSQVWKHPSAWLDLRYFFFHRITGHFFVMVMGGGSTLLIYKWITGIDNPVEIAMDNLLPQATEIGISIVFMLVSLIVIDFIGYLCHYLQHKSVFLWQFHKVHHSAEVMHPVSNFREHPIDNLLYVVMAGVGYGAVFALATLTVGFIPSAPSLLGVPIFHLLFNVAGYNLRHSHIWLRWPGKWSMIFPSPAHHHVHHSYHPEHIDKNFAFILPIWDVIFKTYHMPEDNRDVKFGIGEGNADELTSCARLYWVPVRDGFRVITARLMGRKVNMSKPEPVSLRREPQNRVHPAE